MNSMVEEQLLSWINGVGVPRTSGADSSAILEVDWVLGTKPLSSGVECASGPSSLT